MFVCSIFCEPNPLAEGFQRVADLLELIQRSGDTPQFDQVRVGKETSAYSLEAVKHLMPRKQSKGTLTLKLTHSDTPEMVLSVTFMNVGEPPGLWLLFMIPLDYFAAPSQAEQRSTAFVGLIRSITSAFPPLYGYGHSQDDVSLGDDPVRTDPFAPKRVYEVYWLNIYGSEMVTEIGRERLISTPAAQIEDLPDGGSILLTRPTPTDYLSDAARVAQAQAFAHLRPDVTFEAALARLRARSAILKPVDRDWDPDIKDILALTLTNVAFADRQKETLRLNTYRPPPVSEYLPEDQIRDTDVGAPDKIVQSYEALHAEQLTMLLHDAVPEVMQATPESLPKIDFYFWRHRYPERFDRQHIDTKLIPAIGAYLGMILVQRLGGRWIPRNNLDEAQVQIGDTAWLPFLRARHYMQTHQSILDHSLTQFYRVAARTAADDQKR